MTAATCPRCGRELAESIDSFFASCDDLCGDELRGMHDSRCREMEVDAAYRRGISRGVALAKEHARVPLSRPDFTPTIEWSAVDAAAKGE